MTIRRARGTERRGAGRAARVWVGLAGLAALASCRGGTNGVVEERTAAVSAGYPSTIVAGGFHACVIVLPNQTVECWGANGAGQLGNGTTTDSSRPVAVSGLSGVVALAAGVEHTCALLSDQSVRCWGLNANGELGNGSKASSSIPVAVQGLFSVSSLALGSQGLHACAVMTDGTVRCWGNNADGQLGNGSNADSSLPVTVAGLTGVMKVAVGQSHTCAITTDHKSTYCWGLNSTGQLGNGGTGSSRLPVSVTNEQLFPFYMDIAAGASHTCGIDGGEVECWGDNFRGELGTGSTARSLVPVVIVNPSNGILEHVSAGSAFSCAYQQSDFPRCWGANDLGQLGLGTTDDALVPTQVPGPFGPGLVAAGFAHACAFDALAVSPICWGWNSNGQLGDPALPAGNTTLNKSVSPVPVAGFNAQPCKLPSDCVTGFCVDGVCCDDVCGGTNASDCQACSVAAGASTDGHCSLLPSTRVCRPTAGVCDVAESCTGASPDCPLDILSPAGTQCAAGAPSLCHEQVLCDGSEASCPAAAPPSPSCAVVRIGGEVSVDLNGGSGAGGMTLVFKRVSSAGSISVDDPTPAPNGVPAGAFAYQMISPLDSMSWTFSTAGLVADGPLSICAAFSPPEFTGNGMRMVYNDPGAGLTDITTSIDPVQHVICGSLPSVRSILGGGGGGGVDAGAADSGPAPDAAPDGPPASGDATSSSTPPFFTDVPPDLVVEATSPAGATVVYSVSASDANDGGLVPTCDPPAGSVFPIGTTMVTCEVTNSAGLSASTSFRVTVTDSLPPVLSLDPPPPVRAFTTNVAGTTVNFALPTAIDLVDGVRPVACSPASGSVFAPGKTSVTCVSADAQGNQGSLTFTVQVIVVGQPCSDSSTCDSGFCVDGVCCSSACGGNDATDCQACSLAAGATEDGMCTTLGSTHRCHQAVDACDQDTFCAGDPACPAPPKHAPLTCDDVSATTTPVTYDLDGGASVPGGISITFVELDSPGNLVFTPIPLPPGATAPPGYKFQMMGADLQAWDLSTTATYTGQIKICFNFSGLLPSSADAGADGGVDTSVLALVHDDGNGQAECGATFCKINPKNPVGGVVCGTTKSLSPFAFVAPLSTPPVVTVPGDMTVEATSAAGATVTFPATANDAEDGPLTPTCTPKSGSTFPLGATVVTCGVSDSSGVPASASFTITVADTWGPIFIGVPGPIGAYATSPSGAKVSYAAPTATDAVDGARPVICAPTSGSMFPLKTTTVTCMASDLHGHASKVTFPVTVTYQAPTDGSFFLFPIRADGRSVFHAGLPVPVRFKLQGASAGITNLTAKLVVTKVSSAVQGTVDATSDESVDDTDFVFKYRPLLGWYAYRWRTRDASQGTYQLRADLGDGVTHQVNVSIKTGK